MKNRRVLSSIFLFMILYFLFCIGCTSFQKAVGKEDVVIAICEDEDWNKLESILKVFLEKKEPYSLERRPFFELKQVNPEHFGRYRFHKNLLLIGVYGSNSILTELLSEKAKEEVLLKKALIFEKRDAWAEGQSLLIVTGIHEDTLSSLLKNYGEFLFNFYQGEVLRRVVKRIFEEGVQVELAQRFRESYGWSIRLPKGYQIAREDSLGRFVQMIRHFPDRIITLYWEDRKDDEKIIPIPKDCLDLRDSLAERYFEGDRAIRERSKGEESEFQERKSLRVTGFWENEEKVMGGPFLSYCFIQGKRFYFLDLHLFAPGEKKWLYLLQLEEIAKTFETVGVLR